MCYNYGSPPEPPYNYLPFVKHLAPVLPPNDFAFFWTDSLDWRDNQEIPLGLFRAICHWKSPRRFQLVEGNTQEHVNERWGNALELMAGPEPDVQGALGALTELDGVRVRTASALLTAWNPGMFGIIDFKVLEVLGLPETYTPAAYVAYRNTLCQIRLDLGLHDCALRQIELALWHYYPIQKTGQHP